MAARLNKLHTDNTRFYVYDVLDEHGSVIYVGKGSGFRARVSCAYRGGASFSIVQRFSKEKEAYKFEISRIADLRPPLNIAKGGNGAKATIRREVKSAWQQTYEAIGSKRYAALLLVSAIKSSPDLINPSKIDAIREIAYG